jgi:hypothetical protein
MMGITKLTKMEDLAIICGVNRVSVYGVNDLKTVVGSLSPSKASTKGLAPYSPI